MSLLIVSPEELALIERYRALQPHDKELIAMFFNGVELNRAAYPKEPKANQANVLALPAVRRIGKRPREK